MLLNLYIPKELDIFSQYLEIANADFDIMNQILPDIMSYIIDEEKINVQQT